MQRAVLSMGVCTVLSDARELFDLGTLGLIIRGKGDHKLGDLSRGV